MSTALASQNETPPAPAGTGARKLTERAFRIRESGIIVVLVVFVAVTASVQPRFLNITNIQFILVNTTVFALLALGETMVVISRNYDLSVGSVLGLSAYLSASLFGGHPGFPIPLAFLAGLGIGLGCGMLNGIMAATEVNARWQREMAPYFTDLDGLPPDQGFKRVGEIFHVD